MIGQDQANDVSHIFLVKQRPGGEPRMTALVRNARIFHLHACTLGASYAVKHGVTSLRWKKVMTYAWSYGPHYATSLVSFYRFAASKLTGSKRQVHAIISRHDGRFLLFTNIGRA